MLKKVFKVIISSILGAVVLYIINEFGNNCNFHIGLNWWTVFSTGFLGFPGIILMVVLKLFV